MQNVEKKTAPGTCFPIFPKSRTLSVVTNRWSSLLWLTVSHDPGASVGMGECVSLECSFLDHSSLRNLSKLFVGRIINSEKHYSWLSTFIPTSTLWNIIALIRVYFSFLFAYLITHINGLIPQGQKPHPLYPCVFEDQHGVLCLLCDGTGMFPKEEKRDQKAGDNPSNPTLSPLWKLDDLSFLQVQCWKPSSCSSLPQPSTHQLQ